MRQLPTNPILAALPTQSAIGAYQQDSSSMLPRAHVVHDHLGYDPAGLALDEPTFAGLVHLGIAAVAAACAVVLMFIVASRLSGDANWRGWTFFTGVTAVATIACIVVYGVWSTRAFGYAGSCERAAIVIPALWGACL